ncbi:hypothetical protein BGW80DRAFT_455836 [Lactifluus volemus]|nr:hypothetical protein BGW80DRAFT_455836 [Lactifluus volemus]
MRSTRLNGRQCNLEEFRKAVVYDIPRLKPAERSRLWSNLDNMSPFMKRRRSINRDAISKWNMNTLLHSKHSPSAGIEARSPCYPTCSAFPPLHSTTPPTMNYLCVITPPSFSKLHHTSVNFVLPSVDNHGSLPLIFGDASLCPAHTHEGAWTWLSSHILEDTLHLDSAPHATPIPTFVS